MTLRLLLTLLLAGLTLLAPATMASAHHRHTGARASSSCSAADTIPDSGDSLRRAGRTTLCLVNRERRERGLRSLRSSGELDRTAEEYSGLMVRHRFFAHESPGGRGLLERIRRDSRYLARAASFSVGENLAWGSGQRATPRQIVRSWMASPGHRANILNAGFRQLGVGVALGAPAEVGTRAAATYTHHFGRRAQR